MINSLCMVSSGLLLLLFLDKSVLEVFPVIHEGDV